MLKFLSDLSDDNEYAIVCWGGLNARPRGTEAEMQSVAQELFEGNVGESITVAAVPGTPLSPPPTYLLVPTVGTLSTADWVGARIRVGTNTSPLAGHGVITAVQSNLFTVEWDVVPASGTNTQVYVYRDDFKSNQYPQVRVLTPYMPIIWQPNIWDRNIDYPTVDGALADPGAPLVIPGYTVPPGLTSFREMGLFLPYTNKEGQQGYGECEWYPTTNAGQSSTASTWVVAGTLTAPDGYFADGYLLVDWETGGVAKRSWARLVNTSSANVSGTPSTFTLNSAGWQGDGNPSAGHATARWTVWVDYIGDNPNYYNPGPEFGYANNDLEPPLLTNNGPAWRSQARALPDKTATGESVGVWLNFAMRMSATIGKRVNLIMLGISGSSLYPTQDTNASSWQGTWGWYDNNKAQDWDTSRSDSLYARLTEMISPMAGYALTAEGNSKPLKILAIAGMNGETDAIRLGAREVWGDSLQKFVTKLRDYIEDAGLSPYANGARIPVVHPQLAVDPIETGFDTQGLMNDGTRRLAYGDQFMVTLEPDDAERNAIDNSIYTGQGYAQIGAWMHDALTPVIDFALSYGSTALDSTPTDTVDLCNRALGLIGESTQITSLDDGSFEANLCKDHLPDVRDELLQLRRWSFAEKRITATQAIRPVDDTYEHWEYVYHVPEEALCAFAVLPKETDTTSLYYDGLVTHREVTQPFVVEEVRGARFLFTNLEDAVIRYTERVVDPRRFSPSFRNALTYMLAARIAGPLIKGEQGEATSERLRRKALAHANAAAVSEGQQRTLQPRHIPNHLADR